MGRHTFSFQTKEVFREQQPSGIISNGLEMDFCANYSCFFCVCMCVLVDFTMMLCDLINTVQLY